MRLKATFLFLTFAIIPFDNSLMKCSIKIFLPVRILNEKKNYITENRGENKFIRFDEINVLQQIRRLL
jgi:hypothetical protein